MVRIWRARATKRPGGIDSLELASLDRSFSAKPSPVGLEYTVDNAPAAQNRSVAKITHPAAQGVGKLQLAPPFDIPEMHPGACLFRGFDPFNSCIEGELGDCGLAERAEPGLFLSA